ncbi:MAG: PrgI family protein [Moorellales bacterium]
MRQYYVPELWEEYEEKIIGGFLSLRQFLYLLAGVGFGAMAASALPGPLVLRAVPVVVFGAGALFLGCFEVPGMGLTADRCIALWWKFRKERKEYPYLRRRAVCGSVGTGSEPGGARGGKPQSRPGKVLR